MVPVVIGLLAFCNGQGVGRQCTHASCGDRALPVFSGTGLAAADVEIGGSCSQGGSRLGTLTLPRRTEGPSTQIWGVGGHAHTDAYSWLTQHLSKGGKSGI